MVGRRDAASHVHGRMFLIRIERNFRSSRLASRPTLHPKSRLELALMK